MATPGKAQILLKANYGQQHILSIPPPSEPLGPSSVRVRPLLVGLTANNIAYCHLGDFIKFWDVLRVPSTTPSPFNDASTYGMVPTWGFAEVLESTTSIPAGGILWGVWPVSTAPVDLPLTRLPAPANHWAATHDRVNDISKLHTEYVHHIDNGELDKTCFSHPDALPRLAWTAVIKPVWETAYIMNRFTFSAHGEEPIHMMPPCNFTWTHEDADLSGSVLVVYAAGSRTAQSFVYELKYSRPASAQPKGVLAVTNALSLPVISSSPSPTKIVHYNSLTQPSTLDWIASHAPKRVVSIDYGGPASFTESLQPALNKHSPELPLLQIGVGTIATTEPIDVPTFMESVQRQRKFMTDGSGQRAIAIERLGRGRYMEEMNAAWAKVLQSGELTGGKMEIGEGIEGEHGFEGGWKRQCEGKFEPSVSMAFKL